MMIDLNVKRPLYPLTALRFFAAAMIVVFHAGGRGLGPGWMMHFALGQGVSFFFILSGFVLAYSHPKIDGFNELTSFYIARLARIWPSHIASCLLYVLLIGSISYFTLPADSRKFITVAYVTLTHAWIPISDYVVAYNTVSWSISTEFFFYLVFPFLIANWSNTWRSKLLAAFALTCVMWILATKYAIASNGTEDGRGNLGYINPLARLLEFALGIGLFNVFSIYRHRISIYVSGRRATLIEGATLLTVGVSLWLSHELASSAKVAAVMTKTASMVFATTGLGTVVFAVTIFVFAIGGGAVSKLLRTRPLVFLGEISFGLYLVHTLFLLYMQQAPGVFAEFSATTIYVMYWVTGLSLATLLHFGVERPCQTLIRGAGRSPGRSKLRACLALGVFCIVVAGGILLQPSTRSHYGAAVNGSSNLLEVPATFISGYRLDRVETLRDSTNAPTAIRFAWTAEAPLPLNKRVAVHLLDETGKMVGQLDFVLETGFRRAERGAQWSNFVALNGATLRFVTALGIGVYDASGMTTVVPSPRHLTDWNGQRLLVAITEDGLPARGKSAQMPVFVAQIRLADIAGNWAAGSGIAKITVDDSGNLVLTAESGLVGAGTVNGNRIEVPGWGVSGRLTADRQAIRWSNGFVWRRADGTG